MNPLGLQSIVLTNDLESFLLVTNMRHAMEKRSYMLEVGSFVWRAVDMELSGPYVFVRYGQLEEGVWVSQRSILWRSSDIVSFCQDLKTDQTRKIIEVGLLLEHRGDCKTAWCWVSVDQLWLGQSSIGEDYSPVYISNGGIRIDALGRTLDINAIKLREKLYCASEEDSES
jgi:hypothetical protein